jgi:bisphosphoglycerate-dependent phosphoglycerate mutase
MPGWICFDLNSAPAQTYDWSCQGKGQPPDADKAHPYHPSQHTWAKDLRLKIVPNSESFLEVYNRVHKLWLSDVEPALSSGLSVLVVVHDDSLKAIVKCATYDSFRLLSCLACSPIPL